MAKLRDKEAYKADKGPKDKQSSGPTPKERSTEAGAANLAAFIDAGGKPNERHGVHTFLAGGELPAAIREKVEHFEAELLSDLAEAPTAAQRALVDSSRVCLAIALLGFDWVAANGAVARSGKPAGVLSVIATYLNTLRLNLVTLMGPSLARRAKATQTLDQYIAGRAKPELADK